MPKVTFEEFCRALNLDPTIRDFAESQVDFAYAQESLGGRIPFFMERSYYAEYLPWIGSDTEELLPLMDRVAAMVAADPMLALYAWHAHLVLFVQRVNAHIFGNWPLVPKLGDLAGVFDLMLGMSAISLYVKSYRELGLPAHYACDAAKWLGGTVEIHRASHEGRPGTCRGQLFWLKFYIERRLFRIGRFEFMSERLNAETPHLFRHRQTNELIALCRPGWKLNAAGLRCLADEPSVCETAYECGKSEAVGTPIDPRGCACVDRTVRLNLTEYAEEFDDCDIVPGMHIPGGGHMTLDAAREAFQAAVVFYEKYLNLRVKGFCCFSWIFNPAFEREWADSNLARLMRQVYLFPSPSYGKDGLFFAFGRSDGDFNDYPADNRLRQAFHRVGEPFRSGGMLLCTRDLERFGDEFYRKSFPTL